MDNSPSSSSRHRLRSSIPCRQRLTAQHMNLISAVLRHKFTPLIDRSAADSESGGKIANPVEELDGFIGSDFHPISISMLSFKRQAA